MTGSGLAGVAGATSANGADPNTSLGKAEVNSFDLAMSGAAQVAAMTSRTAASSTPTVRGNITQRQNGRQNGSLVRDLASPDASRREAALEQLRSLPESEQLDVLRNYFTAYNPENTYSKQLLVKLGFKLGEKAIDLASKLGGTLTSFASAYMEIGIELAEGARRVIYDPYGNDAFQRQAHAIGKKLEAAGVQMDPIELAELREMLLPELQAAWTTEKVISEITLPDGVVVSNSEERQMVQDLEKAAMYGRLDKVLSLIDGQGKLDRMLREITGENKNKLLDLINRKAPNWNDRVRQNQ